MSSVTGVQIGIYITPELRPELKIRLVNKNDLSIDLTVEQIDAIFGGEIWNRLKAYFKSSRDDQLGVSVAVGDNLTLIQSKVFRRKSVTFSNGDSNIAIYDLTYKKFKIIKFAIKNYYESLKTQIPYIEREIPKIRELFIQNLYISTNDDKIVKAVFKASSFDLKNNIQCELALICYKSFLIYADKLKRAEIAMSQE